MQSNVIEVLLFSKSDYKNKRLVDQIAKNLLPVIMRQEYKAEKIFLKSMKDTPAVYMS